MRAIVLWALLTYASYVTASLRFDNPTRQVNETSLNELPGCARTCQQNELTQLSCTLAADCYCQGYGSKVFTSINLCVQKSCPTLADLMQWQRFRAETCNIQPRNRGLMQDLVTSLLFVAATITMIGRLLSRWQRMGGPGFWWDDWIILFVWASSIQMIVVLVLKSHDDAAWDSWAVTPRLRELALLWVYSSIPSYFIGTFGAKVSLVLLYLRVVADNKTFRHICWWTIFLIMAGLLGFMIGGLVTLWPLYYYEGDTAIPRQKLLGINFQISVFAIAACNIWLDFVVLLLPIGLLSRIRGISHRWKIWISAIFMTGFAATAISIVRLVYIFPLRNSTNVSWDFGWFGLWCEIEVHVSTICANMPPMAGLLRRRWVKSHRRAASEDVSALNTGMICVGASATTDSGSTQPASEDIEVSRAETMRALEVGRSGRTGDDVFINRGGGSFGTDAEKGRNSNNLHVVHEARDVMKER